MSRSVAIYGGSFDPPHVAHVLVASYVLATVAIDELLVIPTWQHALEKHVEASFEHRLEMCQLAMGQLPRTQVSDIERELGGPSRTLDTLEALAARRPGVQWRLVVGADLLAESHRWYAFDEITKRAPLIVVGRAGHEAPSAPLDMPPVHSTDVRERLRAGDSTAGLVPLNVATYIAAHALYRAHGEQQEPA